MISDRKVGYKSLIYFSIVLIFGLMVIVAVQFGFNSYSDSVDKKISNTQMEITIGRYILSHLQTIETEFYQIALSKNSNYSIVVKKDIAYEIEHLIDSFKMLREGGESIHHIDLNIVNQDEYIEKIYYEPTENRKFSIETIDLAPKLNQTLNFLDTLTELLKKREKVIKAGDKEAEYKVDQEISNFMKVIPPFFLRMRENANRLIYESKIIADQYEQELLKQKKLFETFQWVSSIITISIILVLAYYFGKKLVVVNKTLVNFANEAQKANFAKTQFVANMSHEIRTPLNAIIGFGEALGETKDLPNEEKEYIEIIRRNSKSLLDIINDVLDFSKMESQNFTVETTNFNIWHLLEDVVELYSIKAEEFKNSIIFTADEKLPKYVLGDPVRLKQVLGNLLSNAIKFTEANGKVTLSVIVESVTNEKVKIKYSIKDTGIGISKENQEKIFRSFEQADFTTTRKYGGTGLGLAISKKIVEALKGELVLVSEINKGSEFSFIIEHTVDEKNEELFDIEEMDLKFGVCQMETVDSLIREKTTLILGELGKVINDFAEKKYDDLDMIFFFKSDGMVQRLERIKLDYPDIYLIFVGNYMSLTSNERKLFHDKLNEPLYKSKIVNLIYKYSNEYMTKKKEIKEYKFEGKILVAEDNKTNQRLLDVILKKVGIHAVFVENGQLAINEFEKSKPDLIFMDLHMPIMGGIEAASKIYSKATDAGEKIIIIALTADVLTNKFENLKEKGFSDFLAKPIDATELNFILNKYLNKTSVTYERDDNMTKDNTTNNLSENKSEEFVKYSIDDVLKVFPFEFEEVIEIIDDFYSQYDSLIASIRDAHNNRSKDELKVALHTLKGVSSNLRFTQGAEKLVEMEQYALNEEYEKIDINWLEKYYENAKKDIEEERSKRMK
jgi:signal transduction histidine kinase/CheY-like chemotaxis protein